MRRLAALTRMFWTSGIVRALIAETGNNAAARYHQATWSDDGEPTSSCIGRYVCLSRERLPTSRNTLLPVWLRLFGTQGRTGEEGEGGMAGDPYLVRRRMRGNESFRRDPQSTTINGLGS